MGTVRPVYKDGQGRIQRTVTTDQCGKTTWRDSTGRIQGTSTTDRYGKTTYRDASGRIQGTETTDRYGKTTYRDAQGRIQATKKMKRVDGFCLAQERRGQSHRSLGGAFFQRTIKNVCAVARCVAVVVIVLNIGCASDGLNEMVASVRREDLSSRMAGRTTKVEVDVRGLEGMGRNQMEDWLKRVSRSELASANVFGRIGNGTEGFSPDFRVVVRYDIESRGTESDLVVCALTVIDEKTKETLIQKRSRSYEAAPKGLKDACRSAIEEVVRSCQSNK